MALERRIAYLLLGSNLGNPQKNLEQAIALLNAEAGTVLTQSAVYETAAWGKTDQPAFLNQALCLETDLSALTLLDLVLDIEKRMGRVRLEKWGERLIDIDLILFGDEVIHIEDKLQVPHPQMQFRKFVMEPLTEIAQAVKHPVLGLTMKEILDGLSDPLDVTKLEAI